MHRPERRPLRALRSALVLCAAFLAACGGGDDTAVQDGVVDRGTPANFARMVDRMLPALERLSGLDRLETLRVRQQSRDGARRYMEQRLAEEMPPEELEAVRRTYVALGLLPDSLDLSALLLDLYTEQVIGYYDPGEKTLFLVAGQAVRDLESVMAHELVHALQDQHADLDSLIAAERGNDAQTAAHAAMEGHALLVMFAYMAERATDQRVDPAALPDPSIELAGAFDASTSEFPVFRRAPPVIRETLLFPYAGGSGFVHALWSSMRPRDRYPAPLDSLLPLSTEQIMRPRERFIEQRDAPVRVDAPRIPEGWTTVRENDLGQLEIAILLEQHLGADARSAAHGWGGDRYVLASRDGIDVLYWNTAWDSATEADRFADAMRRVAAARPDRSIRVERQQLGGSHGVVIVDAPASSGTGRPTATPDAPPRGSPR